MRRTVIVEQNEWCGNCDWEGLLLLDVTHQVPESYGWDCPSCDYEHRTESDEEVGADIEVSWRLDGWTRERKKS